MAKRLLLAAGLVACLGAHAQDSTDAGTRPPVMSLRDAVLAQKEESSAPAPRHVGVPGLGSPRVANVATAPAAAPEAQAREHTEAAPQTPDEPVEAGSVQSASSPASTTREASARPKASAKREFVRPPPPTMTVKAGENHVIGIAYSHLNRIVTPFVRPTVKTTSLATTSVEGSIVYVATNLAEPVGMFIAEASRPELAISLTLVPAEIPPVSTSIRVQGMEQEGSVQLAPQPQLATAFELQHTYLEMLKVLFRDLALGRVPEGYGLERVSGHHRDMPFCDIPGVHVIPLQLVSGGHLRAFVAKAHNTSAYERSIDESACDAPGVRAVSAWPTRTLRPGEATELFIALDAGKPDEAHEVRRPSTLEAAHGY